MTNKSDSRRRKRHRQVSQGALYTECVALCISKALHRCIIGRIIYNGLLEQFYCKLSARWYENARWSLGRKSSTCHRRRKGNREKRGERGLGLLLPRKREPVKALILNTWVTSQYLDALTRATDISPPGVA